MTYLRKKIISKIFISIIIFTAFTLFTASRFVENVSQSSRKIETRDIPLTGNTKQLKGFFKALKNSKKQIVRIAHYGDSSLLGDVITEQLRLRLQEEYGGEGAGFVSVCAGDVTMKESGIQKFSDDWNYTSLFLRNPENLVYGVSGYVSKPVDGSWVRFETTGFIRNLKKFSNATLYYSGAGNNSKVECIVDDRDRSLLNLNSGKGVKSLKLFNKKSNEVELKFKNPGNTNVYGVSFEKGNGVYVDNFPITGNTGVNLLDISDKVLKDFKKYLDYNLIILHYGMNLPTPKGGTLKIYKSKMLKVIKKYKKIFPNAGIVLVSISDRILRKGNKVITSKETKRIIDTQKKIAMEGDIAFWNLFEAMGGKDSMDKWVSSAPPLALKDYRHFTHDGGEIVANLLLDAIMRAEK